MSDAVLNKYMLDGELRDVNDFDSTYHNVNPSAYEVIRIMNGRPLFLEEHYGRLVSTMASINRKPAFDVEQLRENIRLVANANDVTNYNIKLVINEFENKPEGKMHLFLIKTSYPTDEMYESGVATDLFSAVRNNPQAKIIDKELRDRENAYIEEHRLFEVLLTNERNEITEGSRSNTFFIKGDSVFTAPAEGVLLGVTRQRILRICSEAGITVKEVPIKVSELTDYEAAFISGTSPKVLPVSRIGDIKMDEKQPLLRKIMKLYDEEIVKYNAQNQ